MYYGEHDPERQTPKGGLCAAGTREVASALEGNKTLTHLDVSCNNLVQGDLIEEASPTNGYRPWYKSAMTGLAAIMNCNSLVTLDINGNNIGLEGASTVLECVASHNKHCLSALDVCANQIDQETVLKLESACQESGISIKAQQAAPTPREEWQRTDVHGTGVVRGHEWSEQADRHYAQHAEQWNMDAN